VTDAAKISRRTFYEYFSSKEDCFLAAYEMIDEHVRGSMLAADGPPEPWPEQVRARLAALLDVLSRDLAVARFYLTEPLAAGGEIAARYRDAMQLLAETIRAQTSLSEIDVEVRDQALMGGIATLIARRLNAGEAGRLNELLPDLTELALAPYLGRDEARRFARG
jgi:AcrR family transcriptional regulator